MVKGIILIGFIILVAAGFLISSEFTGKTVTGPCSGTNTYYLCVDGEGDFVLAGSAVSSSEINETIGDYLCKSVALSDNEDFVFRYTNNAVKGVVYKANQELLGENLNMHVTANYKCYVEGDCSLQCSEYRVFE